MQPQKIIATGLSANLNLTDQAAEPLPAYYSDDGNYTIRWKLTLWDRLIVFLRGNLWLNLGGYPPAMRLDVEVPYRVVKSKHPPLAEETRHDAVNGLELDDEGGPDKKYPELAELEDNWRMEPEDLKEERKRKGDDYRGFYS